jgi:hypothetical protein
MVGWLKVILSSRPGLAVIRWFDAEAAIESMPAGDLLKVDWLRIVPLIFLHLMCLGVIWVGWSWTAIITALMLYLVRMFAVTGFYHRYFSHKTFKSIRLCPSCWRCPGWALSVICALCQSMCATGIGSTFKQQPRDK